MIDAAVFNERFALLLDRFGRTMGAPSIREYKVLLDGWLTTEQFDAASRVIFAEDAYWPSPRRFVTAAKGDPKADAEGSWSRLVAGAHKGERPELSKVESFALQAIGGFRELMYAEGEAKQNRLRREYLTAFQQASSPSTRPQLEDSEVDLWSPN